MQSFSNYSTLIIIKPAKAVKIPIIALTVNFSLNKTDAIRADKIKAHPWFKGYNNTALKCPAAKVLKNEFANRQIAIITMKINIFFTFALLFSSFDLRVKKKAQIKNKAAKIYV